MFGFVGNAQKSESVVEIINNKAVIIADKEVLLKNWNINLEKYEGIKGEFTNIEVKEINKNYYLVATGKVYKSSIILVQIAKTNSYEGAGISCTTSDCASSDGCVPDDTKTKCSPCVLNCTKTTTSHSLIKSLTQQ